MTDERDAMLRQINRLTAKKHEAMLRLDNDTAQDLEQEIKRLSELRDPGFHNVYGHQRVDE